MVRYRIGRLLQLLGMLVLPLAISAELSGKVTLGRSMLIALGGALVFLAGTKLLPGE